MFRSLSKTFSVLHPIIQKGKLFEMHNSTCVGVWIPDFDSAFQQQSCLHQRDQGFVLWPMLWGRILHLWQRFPTEGNISNVCFDWTLWMPFPLQKMSTLQKASSLLCLSVSSLLDFDLLFLTTDFTASHYLFTFCVHPHSSTALSNLIGFLRLCPQGFKEGK